VRQAIKEVMIIPWNNTFQFLEMFVLCGLNRQRRSVKQMEVDSVHSVIERKLKNKPIYVPANYIDIFEGARTDKPWP
jgi:hypothetical protein